MVELGRLTAVQIRLIWANRLRCLYPAVRDPEAVGKESPDGTAAASGRGGFREEATVEEHFVWMTTRQLKPGTLAEFERAWRPDTHPEGMLRAYAYWSADEREIIGVSFWASQQLCERGGPRGQRPAGGRRWPLTSSGSRSGFTAAESSTCPLTSS